MKKNGVFKFLFFLNAICILAGLSVLHSCKKDVEPINFYMPSSNETITLEMIDYHSKLAVSDVDVKITYPNGDSETITISDVIVIDIKDHEDGNFTIEFDKDGYIPSEHIITVNRTGMPEGSDWVYPSKVLMTEVNAPVLVEKGKNSVIPIACCENSSVKFTESSLSSDVNIVMTETPSADQMVEESHELELTAGKIALKAFTFLPEGQRFEEPIEVSFPIPETDEDLEFSTLVDGAWESVAVEKNGDGTGTARIKHFSDWILSTTDRWTFEGVRYSDPIYFTGACDKALIETIDKSFDSDDTRAKEDQPSHLNIHFTVTKKVNAHLGYEKTGTGQYSILRLTNVSKDYTIEIPSLPVIWWPVEEHTGHTGGAGR